MRNLLPRSLRFRLAFKQTLSLALLVIVLAWGAYRKSRRALNYSLLWIATLALAVLGVVRRRPGRWVWLGAALAWMTAAPDMAGDLQKIAGGDVAATETAKFLGVKE